MTAHTPGPWTVQESGKYVEGATCTVAKIYFLPELMDDAEAESWANARLIAAAPDLLALLEEYASKARDVVTPAPGSLIERTRAAIAKARGGSK
jgi:hypothetical protein